MTWNDLRKIPNQITLVRLLLVPVLWVLAFLQLHVPFAIVVAIAGLTDTLDGTIARKLKQESDFGVWFDSFADNIMGICVPFWLWLLMADFFKQHVTLVMIVVGLFVGSLILGLIKYGQMIEYHLYTNKLSAVLLYVFVVHSLLLGPSIIFLYITATSVMLGNIEEILVTLTHKKMHKNQRSIFYK